MSFISRADLRGIIYMRAFRSTATGIITPAIIRSVADLDLRGNEITHRFSRYPLYFHAGSLDDRSEIVIRLDRRAYKAISEVEELLNELV